MSTLARFIAAICGVVLTVVLGAGIASAAPAVSDASQPAHFDPLGTAHTTYPGETPVLTFTSPSTADADTVQLLGVAPYTCHLTKENSGVWVTDKGKCNFDAAQLQGNSILVTFRGDTVSQAVVR